MSGPASYHGFPPGICFNAQIKIFLNVQNVNWFCVLILIKQLSHLFYVINTARKKSPFLEFNCADGPWYYSASQNSETQKVVTKTFRSMCAMGKCMKGEKLQKLAFRGKTKWRTNKYNKKIPCPRSIETKQQSRSEPRQSWTGNGHSHAIEPSRGQNTPWTSDHSIGQTLICIEYLLVNHGIGVQEQVQGWSDNEDLMEINYSCYDSDISCQLPLVG